MYNRYDNDIHPRETVLDSLSSLIDHNDSLQDHIKFLSSVSITEKKHTSKNKGLFHEGPIYKQNVTDFLSLPPSTW